MRYPKFLQSNETIAFVAPSFGCAIEPYYSAFQNAQSNFSKLGYSIQIGPNCYENTGIGISNTPKSCAKELTDYYVNDTNNVLISCGGGELMCEILNYVDFNLISKANPKWYMGYSDNTNFTFLLTTLCDTASIYGPCASAFGMEPWHEAISDALNLLTGKKLSFCGYDKWELQGLKDENNPLLPYNVTENSIIHKFAPGSSTESTNDIEMSGRLIGGCMDCLSTILGTKFDNVNSFNKKYASDGIIWFLESCDLNNMAVRRTLWQMKNAGWFDNCHGFIIGRPYIYAEECFGLDQYKAVVDILSDYNVPILMDADIGHHPPMIPIVNGSLANIKTKGNSYCINMTLN